MDRMERAWLWTLNTKTAQKGIIRGIRRARTSYRHAEVGDVDNLVQVVFHKVELDVLVGAAKRTNAVDLVPGQGK